MDDNNCKDKILKFSIESWRFAKTFLRLIRKLDEKEQRKYQGYYDFYLKNLDETLDAINCWIVDMEGYDFNIGMGVTPINLDEFEEKDHLYIEQMLEPTIMNQDGIVLMGKAVLGRRQDWELILE
jgi:hypothetical protein